MIDWVSQLQARFPQRTRTSTAEFAVGGMRPAIALSPANNNEAAQIIGFAAQNKIPVIPCGRRTNQELLAPPPSDFLLISTRSMESLIHHEPGDMVATVQAGMRFYAFSDAIAAQGQWLPIDAPPGATIGGIVAANTHGPRAWGYGKLRDMILGMTVVNGDGVLRKCGAKVVKNVTGYSLDKLYIGSFGTLGLITEVTFKLRPLPAEGIFFEASFSTIAEGLSAMRAIAARNLPLEMVRVFKLRDERAMPKVVVCATGTHTELIRIENELRAAVPAVAFGDSDKEGHRSSAAQRSWVAGTRGYRRLKVFPMECGATLRFGCTSSRLDSALKVVEIHQRGHWSLGTTDGVIDISPLTAPEAARISSEFEKLSVNFAWENIVGVNIPNRWGAPRPEWALMKQIKSALDPAGIMNPGRFVV
ncbi:MAG TPA: FAD-binding oxidoreductase [Planctomycetota bacterium]|nr:FAD-binding oxidoreductase [Planctomycetota bacterium]